MPSTKSGITPSRDKRLKRGERGGIELLLIQSVDHLGKQGDVVEVKRGFAMNYLLPQGLATVATDHHKRMVDKHKAKLLQIQHERLAGLRQLAERIAAQSVTIEANANDEGHLYGSVVGPDIVKALKQHDITVTADQVRLKGPLKELGLYTVDVHLGQEIESQLKVWVVPTVGDADAVEKKEVKPEGAAAEAKSGEPKSGGKSGAKKPEAKPAEK
jgi:large subunit ribosomal protein L9